MSEEVDAFAHSSNNNVSTFKLTCPLDSHYSAKYELELFLVTFFLLLQKW